MTTLPIDPNISTLDASGLSIETAENVLSYLTSCFQTIYGADVNLESNSPDGQLLNIFAQYVFDHLELTRAIYSSFSPDSAYGTTLDSRAAINGIARKQGSYTKAYVSITATQAVTITGQDALIANPAAQVFTVADDAGNKYQLATTYAFSVPGTQALVFNAVAMGAIGTLPNTITNIVTVTLGITTANNPSVATDVIGSDEETDTALKIRRNQSFALAATGPADSIEAALLQIPDVTDAFVAENPTSGAVAGVPAYSIWVITQGGTDAEIAKAIYAKKAPGCPMQGSKTYNVPRPDGTVYVVKWDQATLVPIFAKFTLTKRYTGISFDTTAIATALASAINYKLNQQAQASDIYNAMPAIDSNGYVTSVQLSTDNVNWYSALTPADYQHKFELLAANIAITTA